MKAEIECCRAENIVPGDEQDKFLQKFKVDIVMYQSQVEAEWKAEQGKKG